MAGLFDDVERTAATSESPPSTPFKPVVYGSIEPIGSSPNDSLLGASPVQSERVRPGYTFPHQHRIIPPSISGHGRLIIAHRTIPYWIGALFVVGAFGWAVWCALYVYPLLGGHPNNWKFSTGNGR
ncbi:hypothetical protein CC86DRAFT_460116 [Ophiobolus disseminans]|uniref:Uncharacterized protein n=1 Tax=Ophiobolus disseminans TaxID=1469910 RepID=A0A6A6ZIV2_9PLEO|nr:hypothetical protein CC86DRAFT_460116 [Ophiobolus disseminans]